MRLFNLLDEIIPKPLFFLCVCPPYVLEETGCGNRPRGCIILSPSVIVLYGKTEPEPNKKRYQTMLRASPPRLVHSSSVTNHFSPTEWQALLGK